MRIEGNNYSYTRMRDDSQLRAEKLAKLKSQISSDTFNPNPHDVAKKILASVDARKELGIDLKA